MLVSFRVRVGARACTQEEDRNDVDFCSSDSIHATRKKVKIYPRSPGPLSCLRAAQCAIELRGTLNSYSVLGATSTPRRVNSFSSRGSHNGSATFDEVEEMKEMLLFIKLSLGYGPVTAFHVGVRFE